MGMLLRRHREDVKPEKKTPKKIKKEEGGGDEQSTEG